MRFMLSVVFDPCHCTALQKSWIYLRSYRCGWIRRNTDWFPPNPSTTDRDEKVQGVEVVVPRNGTFLP